MKKEPYKEVPLKNSDKMAKVDACNYERVMQHEWEWIELEDGFHCATTVEIKGFKYLWLMEELVLNIKPQREIWDWEQPMDLDDPMPQEAQNLVDNVVHSIAMSRFLNKYQKRDKIKRIVEILVGGKNEHPYMIDMVSFDVVELLDDCNPADFGGKNKIVVGSKEFLSKK